jgi:hypothetical protein
MFHISGLAMRGGLTMQARKNLCGYQSGLEGRIYAVFGRRFIEVANTACGHRTSAFITTALNRMCIPAIILHRRGIVMEANATARAFLDSNISIKDDRLCIRDQGFGISWPN